MMIRSWHSYFTEFDSECFDTEFEEESICEGIEYPYSYQLKTHI